MTTATPKTGKFTGRHMAAIMIAFFGVVIAVNMTMATFATRTFGGKVVENSYVAGQQFNGWLAKGKAQERFGWTTAATLEPSRQVTLTLSAAGVPLTGSRVSATAQHPVGRAEDVALEFVRVAPGVYRSLAPLPAGRWKVHLVIRRGPDEMRLIEDLA